MREGLKTFLAMLEHHAQIVEDLAGARKAAAAETFDVLLADISLPDGNGWELLAHLREANLLPPTAIAMSGFGSASDLLRSEETGFVKHLVKPFLPEELEAILKDARKLPAAGGSDSDEGSRNRPREARVIGGGKPTAPRQR